ncbi:anti-sigma factor domain-containing protein [Thermoactinomyces sp. DSM 45892]|uniref:anti-sigma factor domain-containing protein n=1 Tax=Thermoactinomyces sp. DSM 45892 TaxID=1882753 RepID=UPI000894FC88|nr:anti-sigma factor domain-containing protein [Thermoactinomyces sp. DSM 45892]SDZ36639.1 Anti-sigma factor N-terminus [Thermoactinomyces sp. DSM 45892]
MRRGIILEVKEKHWIVMSADGSFEKVNNIDPLAKVGEEVELPRIVEREPSLLKKKWLAPIGGVATAVACAAIFFFSSLFPEETHASETYFYVDINAGMKVGINEENDVVSIVAMDRNDIQAQNLATKLNQKLKNDKQSISRFTKQMIYEAEREGLINANDTVILSLFDDDKHRSEQKKIQKEFIDQTNFHHVTLAAITLPAEAKGHVKSKNLTPSKYAVWALAKKEGQPIPMRELRNKPISEVVQENKSIENILADKKQIELKQFKAVAPQTEGSDLKKQSDDKQNKEQAPPPSQPKENGESSKTQKPESSNPDDSVSDPSASKTDNSKKNE